MTAREHSRRNLLCAILLMAAMTSFWVIAVSASQGAAFTHPGILHSVADLERIRQNVKTGVEPWAGAWRAFLMQRTLDKSYQPRPLEVVGRGVGSVGQRNISNDGTAAYNNAIAWYVTGDEAYAQKAVEILNAWSYRCKTVNGKDAVLCAGIYGYKFINAAEIIRYTYKKWPENDIAQFKRMMLMTFYPVIRDFAPFANGNWETACLPTIMSLGIFLDDRAMFDRAVRYFMDGSGDGSLTHYIVNEAGQCQESGRDQGHTQVGIGHLASACEIGWHQGLDMYGFANNRLLKGFEYTARYNLAGQVPFEVNYDQSGKYNFPALSAISRFRLAPMYEMVCNHYQNRMGTMAPFTAQAASRRPEEPSIDLPGNGTLLFTLPPFTPVTAPPSATPSSPGPVVAKGVPKAVSLAWIAARDAVSYTVKRATKSGGPYQVIARDIQSTTYTDPTVQSGQLYYYVVSASNAAGTGPETLPSAISAGPPQPWQQQDVGPVSTPGSTTFDGLVFTLEGAGTDIGGTGDQFQFACVPLGGDGVITARFVPQVASQVAKMGLMMRESLSRDAAHVALLLTPKSRRDPELPDWSARLVARPSSGAETTENLAAAFALAEPTVTWGRLTGPCWLRLVRVGDTFTASISSDGRTWTTVGSARITLKPGLYVGLGACSRLGKVTTRVMFDHVAVGKPQAMGGKP